MFRTTSLRLFGLFLSVLALFGITLMSAHAAPTSITYALLCIKNATNRTVNFTVQRGDTGNWESHSTAANRSAAVGVKAVDGSTSLPPVWVSYDADTSSGFRQERIRVRYNRDTTVSCDKGYVHQFESRGTLINLVDTVVSAMPNPPVYAQGTVIDPKLNVRSGPSTEYSVLTQLNPYHQVQITGKHSGWWRVKFQDKLGKTVNGWIILNDAWLRVSDRDNVPVVRASVYTLPTSCPMGICISELTATPLTYHGSITVTATFENSTNVRQSINWIALIYSAATGTQVKTSQPSRVTLPPGASTFTITFMPIPGNRCQEFFTRPAFYSGPGNTPPMLRPDGSIPSAHFTVCPEF